MRNDAVPSRWAQGLREMMRALRELVEAALLALFVFFVLQLSVQNFKVEGSSMEPTLSEGQYLLVNKLVYLRLDTSRLARFIPFREATQQEAAYLLHPPQRGEIIVFHFPRDPRRDFVKRVIGVPGDTVEVRRGVVYLNGLPLEEPYIIEPSFDTRPALRLRPGEYYVLGDHRRASNDSRDWGPVPEENIIGKVLLTYWPPDRFGVPRLVAAFLP